MCCALVTETSCVPVASSSGAESNRVTDEIGGLFLATVCLPPLSRVTTTSHRYICARSGERQWKKNPKQPVCVSVESVTPRRATELDTRTLARFPLRRAATFLSFLSCRRISHRRRCVVEEVSNGAIGVNLVRSTTYTPLLSLFFSSCASSGRVVSGGCPCPVSLRLARTTSLARPSSDFKNVTVRVLAVASRE